MSAHRVMYAYMYVMHVYAKYSCSRTTMALKISYTCMRAVRETLCLSGSCSAILGIVGCVLCALILVRMASRSRENMKEKALDKLLDALK